MSVVVPNFRSMGSPASWDALKHKSNVSQLIREGKMEEEA